MYVLLIHMEAFFLLVASILITFWTRNNSSHTIFAALALLSSLSKSCQFTLSILLSDGISKKWEV